MYVFGMYDRDMGMEIDVGYTLGGNVKWIGTEERDVVERRKLLSSETTVRQ